MAGFYFPANYNREQKSVMLFGWYERETAAIFKRIIKPGMVVVDVGAHIGYYTRLFSKLAGPEGAVYAFEADEANFFLLKKNTAHLANVKLFPVALTDHIGPLDFYESLEKSGCHSTVLGAVPAQRKKTVAGSDLDSIVAREAIAAVDVIKMDIEGGEPLAVQGMQRVFKNNPGLMLVTEVSSRRLRLSGTSPSWYVQRLASFGFDFSVISPEGLRPLSLSSAKVDQFFDAHDPVNLFCSKGTPPAPN